MSRSCRSRSRACSSWTSVSSPRAQAASRGSARPGSSPSARTDPMAFAAASARVTCGWESGPGSRALIGLVVTRSSVPAGSALEDVRCRTCNAERSMRDVHARHACKTCAQRRVYSVCWLSLAMVSRGVLSERSQNAPGASDGLRRRLLIASPSDQSSARDPRPARRERAGRGRGDHPDRAARARPPRTRPPDSPPGHLARIRAGLRHPRSAGPDPPRLTGLNPCRRARAGAGRDRRRQRDRLPALPLRRRTRPVARSDRLEL